MIRGFLTLLLILLAFWMATSVVIPQPGMVPDEEATTVWRRTDQGWQRADRWLKSHEHLLREPVPPLYPIALLPLIVTIGLLGLILGQPKQAREALVHRRSQPHFTGDRVTRNRHQPNSVWRE